MPEQLYCNGKVIFLYNDLTPPAKQVVFGFGHFRFSEHEKLQCPQQAKAHTKRPPAKSLGILQTAVRLLFLFYIFLTEGISALRTEFRRPGGICRFPAALVTFVLGNTCRFFCPAVGAEFSFINTAAGAGPAFRWPGGTAFHTEFSGISFHSAGTGPAC